jgi:hypothetical protein
LAFAGTLIFRFSESENINTKTAEDAFKSDRINMGFSEEYVSDAKLKELSNIIITGTVKKLREKSIKSVKTNYNNESFEVEVPVEIYDLDVTEEIRNSGKAAPKRIGVAVTDTNVSLETGKEYTLILYKITGNSELSDYYGLVSYSQGLYELDRDIQELIPIKKNNDSSIKKNVSASSVEDTLNKNITYSDFKNRFK